MKQKKIFKTLCIVVFLVSICISCEEGNDEVVFYPLKIEFRKKLDKAKKGKQLPVSLKTILNYTKIENESSTCFGKYFVPEITFSRFDLDKEEIIDYPIAEMPFSIETLITKGELDNNYDVNLIEIPVLLTLETNIGTETTIEEGENTFVLNIKDLDNAKEIQQQIIKKLCEDNSVNFTIVVVQDSKPESRTGTGVNGSSETSNGGEPIPPIDDPCKMETLPDVLNLKQNMLVVIDASLSSSERVQKAIEIWDKYFDKDAYVALYFDRNDNNPEVWNPGDGKEYFISRLAMLSSITDVNIFRVEKSKVNNKISGIKIVECHNASQLQ